MARKTHDQNTCSIQNIIAEYLLLLDPDLGVKLT